MGLEEMSCCGALTHVYKDAGERKHSEGCPTLQPAVEYGMQLDCVLEGCDPPHVDNGYVSPWSERLYGPPPLDEAPKINEHAACWVKRTIPDWEPI